MVSYTKSHYTRNYSNDSDESSNKFLSSRISNLSFLILFYNSLKVFVASLRSLKYDKSNLKLMTFKTIKIFPTSMYFSFLVIIIFVCFSKLKTLFHFPSLLSSYKSDMKNIVRWHTMVKVKALKTTSKARNQQSLYQNFSYFLKFENTLMKGGLSFEKYFIPKIVKYHACLIVNGKLWLGFCTKHLKLWNVCDYVEVRVYLQNILIPAYLTLNVLN